MKWYIQFTQLAGIEVCESDLLLYAMLRGSNQLYAYSYDEVENILEPVSLSATTVYRTLSEVGSGVDIAIDPNVSTVMGLPVDRLYVSGVSEDVEFYNMSTWEHEGTITLKQDVVGIGLDRTRGYLYGGYYTGGDTNNKYLLRYTIDGDPNDSETSLEVDLGAQVMDIAVDEETGYIYITTKRYYDGRYGTVEVYDPTDWVSTDPNTLVLLDTENDADFGYDSNGPGGIAIGPSYKPGNGMYINKVDDVDESTEEVLPGDYYYYDIAYHPGEGNETNVVIVDELPDGVNFVSADPNGTYYPRPVHEYVWDLGDVDGSEPNSFYELEVRVNNYAEPEGELINIVSAESDVSYVEAEENTPVGWWGGDVIYVDEDSPGPHTGTSWETAYKYLYDNNLPNALDRVLLAPDPNAMVILVADGRYKPGTGTSDTFALHDTLEVYGGYAGYGAIDPNERDWQKYKSVLSGLISDTSRNNTVVTMGDDSLLDGFVVEEGNLRGIYGNGATSTILNCKIENNSQRGISWINGNLTIQWCEIDNNGWQGINYEGSSYSLTVENCSIHDNLRDGIKTVSSTSTIKNSMIYLNGSETIYYGVNLQNPSSNPDIHNNTIVDNINEGIRFIDNSGNDVPDISNCIVYYNGGDSQFVGLNPDTDADYCCIEDCNEIATNSNFNDEPGFVYDSEPFGYYHIKYDSPCRNAGDNSALGTGEVDMDNEPRIADDAYDIVDVGADEVDCEDTNDPNDWTYDGVINYEEFAIFANSWEKTSTDPNWQDTHSNYNFDNSGSSANVVDVADLAIFLDNWLWEACWHGNYSEVMYAMGGGGSAMMAMPASMSTATLQPAAIEEVSIADQIFELEDCIEFLEQVWLEDSYFQQEIETDAWEEFMDAIYDSLSGLEKTQKRLDKKK